MSSVFLGGSRRVSRLNREISYRLNALVESNLPVLVGDANGADKAVQRYLHDRAYDDVVVFCTEGRCRNNVGNWPIRAVDPGRARKGLEFFAAKDREMAREADSGLMIWDGKSVGTLLNIFRLAVQDKRVAVYWVPGKRFLEIDSQGDFNSLLPLCPIDVRKRVENQLSAERPHRSEALQPSLLDVDEVPSQEATAKPGLPADKRRHSTGAA